MNQSLTAATGAREDQIFLQLLDCSTIPYCKLRPEIQLIRMVICRLTNISVYHQLLTLEGRKLHTGDNIPPNSTIILGFSSRGRTRSHGQFQCLDVLASVFQTSSLNTMYEQTLRKWSQVSTNWHLQVHLSLDHSQWGEEFKTKINNTAVHIQAQHRRLKLPLEVEDSVNTVLDHILCFPTRQQTCMAEIKYLWSALLLLLSGVSVRIFTDVQTCSERCHADNATSQISHTHTHTPTHTHTHKRMRKRAHTHSFGLMQFSLGMYPQLFASLSL